MNLYRIIFCHIAPKDRAHGLLNYILANNEDEVYEFIDREYTAGIWSDREGDKNIFDVYDDDYNRIGTELFRERIFRLKGDINDPDTDLADAYYGITLYGWELVAEDVLVEEFTKIIEYGIVHYATERDRMNRVNLVCAAHV